MTTNAFSNKDLAAALNQQLEPLGVVAIDQELPNEPSIGHVRRRRRARHDDAIGVITLLDVDGVLLWEDGVVTSAMSGTQRRRGTAAAEGEVVTQLKFHKELGINKITEKLVELDGVLTPLGPAKLRCWKFVPTSGATAAGVASGSWVEQPITGPIQGHRALLIVHGTFSNSDNLLRELTATPGGNAFALRTHAYDAILTFDHATLSRSPFVNAMELDRHLEPHTFDELDIVCHSRGGLVTRWWLEVLNRKSLKIARVVFVGCPLQGTSLADPASLRNGLNLLTNAGRLLGAGASLVPLLTAAGGLIQIISSIGGFAARTPLADAALAMIPGLAAQSRTRTNSELDTLNARPVDGQHYSAVLSDFQPADVGWRFWRLFNLDRLANVAGDYLVFQQANDLVVDTDSMTHYVFGPNPALTNTNQFCVFDKSPTVSHTTYFRDSATLEFIVSRLGI